MADEWSSPVVGGQHQVSLELPTNPLTIPNTSSHTDDESEDNYSVSPEVASLRSSDLGRSGMTYLERVLEDQIKSGPELTRIEHVSDLHYPDADPPCHFCSNQSSLSIHDSNRLKIVSRGRISGRDGSRDGSHPPYINLPSPNFQETAQESSTVFPSTTPTVSGPSSSPAATDVSNKKVTAKKGAGVAFCNHDQNADCDEEQAEPPASVLTRRRALVPAKLPPYSTDSCEDIELCGTDQGETSISCTESDCGGPRTRRSSIVVIPPMQICPGDLLVYSKVLTQRSNHLEWDGSTQSLSGDTDSSNVRKQKNSWSLLKLFDRSSRAKSESLAGLEELLSCLQPSVFCDDQLSRYRGLCWSEFLHLLSHQSGEKAARCIIQDRMHSVSSTTGVPFSSAFPSPGHTSSRSRILQRQVTHTDYSTRIKEWTHEKRARFGLVRTLSDRGLDRKLVNEPTLQKNSTDSYLPEDGLCALSITTTTDNAVLSSSEPPMEGSEEEIGSTATTVQKMEERHKEALWDLFQSECSFLYDHLMVLKNVYMDPLKRIQVEGYAMFAEPDLLFGNLDELCCVTYTFCKEFICLLLNHAHTSGDASTVEILTKLFQQNTKVHTISQAYHRYTLNYINALNYLETLRRHAEFCEFEKWCNRDPRCKKLQLTDLLVAPVQHIMKIPLLLREIETRTTGRQEKETVLKILEKEEASIRELDDKMKWLKNFERLLEIQRSLVWPSVLDLEPKIVVPDFLKAPLAKQPCERLIVSPRRQIVLEGPLNLLDSGRPSDMHVILFDDMLLITRKKKGLGKKKSSLGENWTASCSRSCLAQEVGIWRYIVYKQPLSLDRFFLHEINPAEATAAKLDHGFVIICLNRFQQIIGVHTFQASSEQVRHTWMLKLRDTQDRWKRTLQTTVFRSQRTNSSLSSSNISTMNKNQTSQSECKEEA